MNLTQNPALNDLVTIFEGGNHNHNNMLWVETNGEVHLDPIKNVTPLTFANTLGARLKFRYEVFAAGTDIVGQVYSADDTFLNTLFESLVDNWQNGARGFIDEF